MTQDGLRHEKRAVYWRTVSLTGYALTSSSALACKALCRMHTSTARLLAWPAHQTTMFPQFACLCLSALPGHTSTVQCTICCHALRHTLPTLEGLRATASLVGVAASTAAACGDAFSERVSVSSSWCSATPARQQAAGASTSISRTCNPSRVRLATLLWLAVQTKDPCPHSRDEGMKCSGTTSQDLKVCCVLSKQALSCQLWDIHASALSR